MRQMGEGMEEERHLFPMSLQRGTHFLRGNEAMKYPEVARGLFI